MQYNQRIVILNDFWICGKIEYIIFALNKIG